MANKELLLKYAELKIKEAAIEEELELIKPAVLLEIEEIKFANDTQEGVSLAEYPDYIFSIKPGRKSWTYSPQVASLIERLDEQKKAEEKQRLQADTGPATFVEGEKILQFAKRREKKNG